MTTFISALLSLGCFILVVKAIERDAHTTNNKTTDKHDDIDFVTKFAVKPLALAMGI